LHPMDPRTLTTVSALTAAVLVSLAAAPSAATTWQPAEALHPMSTDGAALAQVAGSLSGSAAAAWIETDGIDYGLWVATYEPSLGWSQATRIANASQPILDFQMAGDDAGTFHLVWIMPAGASQDLLATRAAAGAGWSAPEPLEANDTHVAYDVALAVAAGGNAVAAFILSNGTDVAVLTHGYTPSSGWGGERRMHNGSAFVGAQVAAAAYGENDLMAAWTQPNATEFDVVAERFTDAGGHQPPAHVGSGTAGAESLLVLAGSPTGEATAFWESFGFVNSLWIRTYVPGSGWQAPTEYYLSTESIFQMAVCAQDGGTVFFAAFIGESTAALRTGTYAPSVGVDLEVRAIQPSYYTFSLACQRGGQVVLGWPADLAGTTQTWYTVRSPDGSWSTPILPPDGVVVGSLASVGKGGLASVWTSRDGGTYRVFSSFLHAPDIEAPSLQVTAPSDGVHLDQGAVVVRGTTEPGARVVANGVEAEVDANGTFAALVPLLPGPNPLSITARDAAGNIANSNLTVTFDDPVPQLEADLVAARAAAEAAGLAANDSAAQASAAGAQSDALTTQVAQLGQRLNASMAETAAVSLRLNGSMAEVGTLAAAVADADGRIASLQQENAALQAQVNASARAAPAGGIDLLALAAIAVAGVALAAAFLAPRRRTRSG